VRKTENEKGIVGRSQLLKGDLQESIAAVAGSEARCYLMARGESAPAGVLARAVATYKLARERKGPFEAINCAIDPRDVLESELFGTRRVLHGAPSGRTGSSR